MLYRLLCWLVGLVVWGGGQRDLEIVVLRHQLAILRRGGKRPRYSGVDRALLAAASRLLPSEQWSCFAVSPRTLRRWHRALLQGRRRGRRRIGRPPLPAQTRSLIVRLGRENANWGYMRIQGELLKLGIGVSATTVANVLRRSGLGPAPRRIGPTWSEFLRAQAQTLLAGGPNYLLADGQHSDTAEAAASAEDPSNDQVETDDGPFPNGRSEPRLVARPLPVRNRLAPPCVLAATRERRRPVPSHQSRARDGPPWQACPSTQSQHSRATPPAPAVTQIDAISPRRSSNAVNQSVSAQPIDQKPPAPGIPVRVSSPHNSRARVNPFTPASNRRNRRLAHRTGILKPLRVLRSLPDRPAGH